MALLAIKQEVLERTLVSAQKHGTFWNVPHLLLKVFYQLQTVSFLTYLLYCFDLL